MHILLSGYSSATNDHSAIIADQNVGFLSTQIFAVNDEVDGNGTVTDVVLTDDVLWTSLTSVTHTVKVARVSMTAWSLQALTLQIRAQMEQWYQ
jgi:ligand-binding sensor protein